MPSALSQSIAPPDCFLQTCFRGGSPQPVLVYGIVLPSVQDLVFSLAEFHEIPTNIFLQFVKVTE